MHTGIGEIVEISLQLAALQNELPGVDQAASLQIACPRELIPAPGQYLSAQPAGDRSVPQAASLFSAGATANGFLAAGPVPAGWFPGMQLDLRGPLGRGFRLAASMRRLVLAAHGPAIANLTGLIPTALDQAAAVVLASDQPPADLPVEVEVQPLGALPELLQWADAVMLAVRRSELGDLRSMLGLDQAQGMSVDAQVLVITDMPCQGLGECGACTVKVQRGWKMACKDGPVFTLKKLQF